MAELGSCKIGICKLQAVFWLMVYAARLGGTTFCWNSWCHYRRCSCYGKGWSCKFTVVGCTNKGHREEKTWLPRCVVIIGFVGLEWIMPQNK